MPNDGCGHAEGKEVPYIRTPMALILGIILIPALAPAGVGQAQAQPLQVSPVPIWGIVLGTIIVAGLLYLVVHGPDDVY